jgi:hypothetical protein
MYGGANLMKTALVGAALMLAAAASTASAADWKAIGGNKGLTVYLDSTSVHFSSGRAKAWFLYDYGDNHAIPNSYPEKTAMSSKELDLFNCDEGTSATVQIVYLAHAMGAGDVVESVSIPPATASYADVVPDSIGETMLQEVCKLQPGKRVPHM